MTTILKDAASNAASAAHSVATSLLAMSQIAPGKDVPDVKLLKENDPHLTAEGKGDTMSKEWLSTGKFVIIGVPGAFTAPCNKHIPKYIEEYQAFKDRGVKDIYVVAVNDQFVVSAWKDKLAPNGTPIHFVADDQAAWTSATGLIFDATALLGGPRSKRYVMILDNGKVDTVFVEEDPSKITITDAGTVLAHLA